MAKKHKKKHHRRRVGAAGGKRSMLLKIASIAGGFLLADPINQAVAKLVPDKVTPATTTTAAVTTSRENLRMGGELGLGALLLLKKSSGMTGKAMTVAGGLLAGAGLKIALRKAGFMSGYHNVPVIGARHRMASGYQSVPVIGGVPSQLAGMGTPGQLQGYRVGQYASQGSGVIAGIGRGSSSGSGMMNAGTNMMQ